MCRLSRTTLLLLSGLLLASCMREAPDRANAVQVPLFLLVLAAPAISRALRRRGHRTQVVVFVLQLLAYGVYETGVSDLTDNRADLLFVSAAIGLNYWLIFGGRRSGSS